MWTWNSFKSIAQATYSKAGSPRQINATIPTGMAHPLEAVQLIMTRPVGGWPLGGTYKAGLLYPDGATSSVTFGAGDLMMRDGFTPLAQSEAVWTHPSGVFPTGALSLTFSNDQPVTTAIQINWGYQG